MRPATGASQRLGPGGPVETEAEVERLDYAVALHRARRIFLGTVGRMERIHREAAIREKIARPAPMCDRERTVEQRLGNAALSLSRIGRDANSEHDLAAGIVHHAAAQPAIVGRSMPVA